MRGPAQLQNCMIFVFILRVQVFAVTTPHHIKCVEIIIVIIVIIAIIVIIVIILIIVIVIIVIIIVNF